MTKKQFAIIFLIWAIVIATIFATPAKGTEVPLITTSKELMCDESIKDLAAARIRFDQLTEMLAGTTDPHARLVLTAEVTAVKTLGAVIIKWRVEHCRDA